MKYLNKKNSKKAKIIFIHGLESSGNGFKAGFLRSLLPEILTPTFKPYQQQISIASLLEKRMDELYTILDLEVLWIIIGSSFGGLMGTIYALENPRRVSKMILLAPYLSEIYLKKHSSLTIDIPVVVFHGVFDIIVNPKKTKKVATKYFKNLEYHFVEDDHSLHSTTKSLDWNKLTSLKLNI